jgi:Flp pilus assembly protein TadG
VLLFMLGSLLFLLVFGGFAIDLAFYSTTKGELQRSMDAAALAGAAQLGFDDSVFGAVRTEAKRFALLNPTRANLSELNPTGAINLALNTGNADPNGEITLGVWDGTSFTADSPPDGSTVNAVKCQYATDVPTSFLGILGLNVLPVSARAIAVSNPPDALPPGACMFPMGTTSCQFQNAGAYTSLGCGSPMTFATSSGNPPDTQAGTNTAAWTNPNGAGTPDDLSLIDAINAAADGQGTCNSTVNSGEDVGTNNGMIQSVMDVVEGHFLTKYAESEASGTSITVDDVDGNPTYAGFGWEVWVGVIETDCPPQAINQDRTIQTFARFVITQVINHGFCAVNNPADPNSWPLCPPPMNPDGAPRDPPLRGIFGFFQCQDIDDTIPATTAVPRTGLATGTRLVQ